MNKFQIYNRINRLAAPHKGKLVSFTDNGRATAVFRSTQRASNFLHSIRDEFKATRVGAEVRIVWRSQHSTEIDIEKRH